MSEHTLGGFSWHLIGALDRLFLGGLPRVNFKFLDIADLTQFSQAKWSAGLGGGSLEFMLSLITWRCVAEMMWSRFYDCDIR